MPIRQFAQSLVMTGQTTLQRWLRWPAARPVASSPSQALTVEEAEAGHLLPYDKTLLEKSRTQWQFGDWESLTRLEHDALDHHPDRAKLALLAATGHQQMGDMNAARQFVRLAQEWGCSKRLVSQVLISGVYNTLGRAAAIKQDHVRSNRHFRSAVALIGGRETELFSHARAVRELARIGLLPDAARLMREELKTIQAQKTSSEQQAARMTVLQTELDLLHSELSLAQRRQQLHQMPAQVALDTTPDPDNPAWLAAIKRRSVAQLEQDLWVLEKTGYKRGGFFIEFGATDGVLLSNTWLLEKEFDWQGLLAEPNPKLFEKLQKNRACSVSSACISGKTGDTVEFVFANAYGGMLKHAEGDQHAEKRRAYAQTGQIARLTTTSLHDFLQQHNAPKTIDYISIDTEGSELEILQAFPFAEWDVHLFTVEHNHTPQRSAIRQLMESCGYRCTEVQWDDWYEKKFDTDYP